MFAESRSVVGAIVNFLKDSPVNVSAFVGQSSIVEREETKKKKTKKSSSPFSPPPQKKRAKTPEDYAFMGLTQAEQQVVMTKFKNNLVDVLVSTSIGEEGLDVGTVDLIVSYDTVASPTRMVQRFGRAGRKRVGRIVCLMGPGEKTKFKRASAQSKAMHKLLRSNSRGMQVYMKDVRMCPMDVVPSLVEVPVNEAKYNENKVLGMHKKMKEVSYTQEARYKEVLEEDEGGNKSDLALVEARRKFPSQGAKYRHRQYFGRL